MKPVVRKAAEANILKWMLRLDPTGINANIYTKKFPKLSDKQLTELCKGYLPFYVPPMGPVKINLKNVLEIGTELGHIWRQRIWMYDPKTKVQSLTNKKHFYMDTVVRRQTQHVEDKQGFAEHNNSFDSLTGQVSGNSKTSSFSFAQAYEHYARGEHYALVELLVHRGGNLEAGRALDRQIRATGTGSLNFEGMQKTRVQSSVTLGNWLRGMHLGNTL